MKFYLDTNIFYYRYCPIENSKCIDPIFEEIRQSHLQKRTFQLISNEIILSEMFRALKKQVNLEVIDLDVAEVALDFFIADIEELIHDGDLVLMLSSKTYLMKTQKLIFRQK